MSMLKMRKALQTWYVVVILLATIASIPVPAWGGACEQLGVDCSHGNYGHPSGNNSGGGERSSNRESEDQKHFRWAEEYRQEGNLNAAAAEYRKAIADDPDRPGYRNALGGVLYSMKDYAGALEAYRSSASLKPGRPITQNNIGLALWNLHRYAEAEAELTTAIRLDPTYTYAQENLIELVTNIKNEIHKKSF